MRRILFPGLLLLAVLQLHAGEGHYPFSDIPEKLLKNAKLVKRLDQTEFRIINTGETVTRHHYVITVLNEEGDRDAVLVEPYDKLTRISSIEGSLYDANGKEVRRVKTKDMMDLSAI